MRCRCRVEERRNDGLGSGAGDRWLVGGHGVAFTSSRRA